MIERVLDFWFSEAVRSNWFIKNPDVDRQVREHLGDLHEQAATGALDAWKETAAGSLALLILLDQAPRNLFRDTPRAFATDPAARRVARHALERGYDLTYVDQDHRLFFYLPFEHSEDVADQRLAVTLFRERTSDPGYHDDAERHWRIIERFDRFPHRNACLGRDSTPEEIDFLTQPGSSF